jgi:hypothetical protein
MSANDQRGTRAKNDQEMAAALRARGIFHGVRLTKTNAPPVPNPSDVGSAAYRRLRRSE